jgi:hypothetical protein
MPQPDLKMKSVESDITTESGAGNFKTDGSESFPREDTAGSLTESQLPLEQI